MQNERDERKRVIVTPLGEGPVDSRNGFTEACNIVSLCCFVGEFDGLRQSVEVILVVTTSEPGGESRFDELSCFIEVANRRMLELQVNGETLRESINWGRGDLWSAMSPAANGEKSLGL
jgi:hypothetical protein